MKKYIPLLLLICLLEQAFAQDIVIHASKPVSESVAPQQLADSLKKRFPNAEAVQYYQTPADGVRKGWSIEEDDQLTSDETIEFYTLSFKRDDAQYYALYKADGTLVKSKFEEKNVTLPDAVKNTLKTMAGSDYKNYTVQSKEHFKNIDHNTMKEYYEVTAVSKKDKKDKKTVILTADGKIIKVK